MPPRNSTVLSELHLASAYQPITFRVEGRTILSSDLHSKKAEVLIHRIPSGKITSLSEEQLINAAVLITLRVEGRRTCSKVERLLHA